MYIITRINHKLFFSTLKVTRYSDNVWFVITLNNKFLKTYLKKISSFKGP